jgi:peroxiredoxin
MSKIALNKPAPDFTLNDFHGTPVKMSSFRGQSNLLLVFNRGFM